MKEYCISYQGNNYSNVGYYFLGAKYSDANVKRVEEVPTKIDDFTIFEENDKEFILKFGIVNFDCVEEEGFFTEVIDESKTIVFNKETLRAEGQKFDKNILGLMFENMTETRPNILRFISGIINLNENIKNYINTAPSYLSLQKIVKVADYVLVKNFYNMVVFNLPEFEKIINSNNIAFLKNNLNKESFEISEANKLHQVVGLPKFAVQAIKDMKMEEYIEQFKKLSSVVDGNSLNIILTFLSRGQMIFEAEYSGKKKNLRKEKLILFLTHLTKICERKTYKVTDLLNYFIRQSFYSSTTGYFTFPIDEAMYLSDYLDMCEKYGLKADKYPSQLRRMHDICSKNVIALESDSDIYKKDFEKAVDSYRSVEREIELFIKNHDGTVSKKSYCFIVPKEIKDIVIEGNILHHCVGSYGNKIINKEARVVFMRDSEDVKNPLVTIDINEHFDLIEAKKAFNEDVDDIQRKAIDKWLKEIKR